MRRRGWLWFIASAFLALMAGAVAIVALGRPMALTAAAPPAPGYMVVVARQPIAANSILRPDNVQVVERQERPADAVAEVQDVLGQVTLRPLAQGEVIRTYDVAAMGVTSQITGTRNLPLLLGNDKIAVALPADDILSQWGAVMAGDHVDILFTLDVLLETPLPAEIEASGEEALPQVERDQSLDNVSVLTLQNLEVLQVIEEPAQPAEAEEQQEAAPLPARRALVLKIDPQDAVILKYLLDSVGKIDVALRAPENSTLFDVEPVSINYLVMRYGIAVPQPLE